MTYQWHKVSDLIDMAEDASDLMFPEALADPLIDLVDEYIAIKVTNPYVPERGVELVIRDGKAFTRPAATHSYTVGDAFVPVTPPLAKPSIWKRIKRMIGL